MTTETKKSEWESTRTQNLIRYRPSGTYFARFKVGGKLIRKSLETQVFSVAELRLPDKIKDHRKANEARRSFANGRMSFGDAVQIYQDKLALNSELKPRTKAYYGLMLNFIARSWPQLFRSDIREISERDCEAWLARYRSHYAPSVVNNCIGVMRGVFTEAVSAGARLETRRRSLSVQRSRARS